MTVEPQSAEKSAGYLISFVGAIVGAAFALSAFFFVVTALGLTGVLDEVVSGETALGLVVYGQFVAMVIGAATGIGAALAIGQREAPWRTAVISIPVGLAILGCVWGLVRLSDTMGFGWVLEIPPFLIPFLSRWIARAIPRKGR